MPDEYDKDIIHITSSDSSDYKVIQKYFLNLYISCNKYNKKSNFAYFLDETDLKIGIYDKK